MQLEIRPFPQNLDGLQWIGGRAGVGIDDRTVVALVDRDQTVWEAAFEDPYGCVGSKMMTWPRAGVALVASYSQVFALDLATGALNCSWELDMPGPDLVFPPNSDHLLILDRQNIRSLTPTLQTAWYARRVAVDGIRVVGGKKGLMVVDACYDPPDHWKRVTLDLATGEIQSGVPGHPD